MTKTGLVLQKVARIVNKILARKQNHFNLLLMPCLTPGVLNYSWMNVYTNNATASGNGTIGPGQG